MVDTFQKVRALLKPRPDYERCVARCVGSGDSNRNADRVVLYEDMRKAKLNDFLAALESVRAVRDVAEEIASNTHALEKSSLLRALVTGETNADDDDLPAGREKRMDLRRQSIQEGKRRRET